MNGLSQRWLGPRCLAGIALGVVVGACGPPTLESGASFEADLDGQGLAVFTLDLEAGLVYRLIVKELESDLALHLDGPEDALPLVFDTLRFGPALGDESVEIAPQTTGRYRVELRAAAESKGRYALTFESVGRAQEPDRSRVEAAWTLARANGQRRAGETQAALATFEEALRLYRGLGDRLGEARVLEHLVDLRRGSGLPPWEALETALAAYRAAGNPVGELRVLNRKIRAQRLAADPNGALATAEECLALARRVDDSYWTGIALGHLGRLHRKTGAWREAVARHRQALEIWRRIGHAPQIGRSLHALGEALLAQGDADRAWRRFDEALALFESLGRVKDSARTRVSLGMAWLRLGKHGPAEEVLRTALGQLEALGDRAGEASARNDLGNVLYREGRLDEALVETEQGLALYEELDHRPGQATVANSLGRLYDALGHSDLAAESFESALGMARRLGDRSNEASAHIGLARLERRLGQLDTALTTLESALAEVESLRLDTADGPSRADYLASRHDYYREKLGVLMALHRQRPEEGFARQALEVAERARGRRLLEVLRGARLGIAAASDGERRALIDEHQRVRRQLARSGAAQERDLLRRLEAIEVRLAAHVEASLRQDPRFSQLLDPPEIDVAGFLETLPDDLDVLVFHLAEPESLLFHLSADGLELIPLPPSQTLKDAARRSHEAVTRSYSPRQAILAERALDALSSLLLAPVIDRLDGNRLVVLADEALQIVPFAALPDPQDGQPLLRRFAIVRWPSLATGMLLRERLWPAGVDRMAILADPTFGCDDPRIEAECPSAVYPRLRSAEDWLQTMASIVDPSRTLRLVGVEASHQLLTTAALRDYPIVHFYTHGEIDDRFPERSRLVLAQVDSLGRELEPGFLTYLEVQQLDLQADLVVLGACETALGQQVRGEGLVGLTQAFFHAGASRVVATLWSVRDSATARLTTRFYRHLLGAGLPPAAALRQAQLETLNDSETAAPFYWAGVELHGPYD